MGSDPDRTYFIMSVWPVKNPCRAIAAWLYLKLLLFYYILIYIYSYYKIISSSTFSPFVEVPQSIISRLVRQNWLRSLWFLFHTFQIFNIKYMDNITIKTTLKTSAKLDEGVKKIWQWQTPSELVSYSKRCKHYNPRYLNLSKTWNINLPT